LFKDEKSLDKISEKVKIKSEETFTVIENDLNAFIPKDYIENDTERLNVYKRLYELKNTDDLQLIKNELIDRFGEYLEDVSNLLDIIEIKIIASEIGLEKISVHGKKIELYFPKDKGHRIFEGLFFKQIIDKLSSNKTHMYSIENDREQLVIEVNLEKENDQKRIEEIKELLNFQ
jgi:transcription-repair coupling factor (superfamily II helicase)